MHYPKLRELKEAIKALFKGPYTFKFPQKPHFPAEKFRGRPYFYEEECTGCTACAQVCPTGAIKFHDIVSEGRAKRVLVIEWDVCIFCGNCQANCLTGKGIVLSREFDFATTENRNDLKQSIEKDFIYCECCKEAIIPVDQYGWVAQRLGPLCFSNASLLLFYLRLQGLSLEESQKSKKEGNYLRADRVKVLCPACRRKASLVS